MNPTNTKITPEIKNFADNNGDKHTAIPTPHTHTLSEISDYPGSESTPTLGSSKLVTSGGVKTALNGKMDNKTIDQTPTDGNTTHLISSDAVYEALKDMAKWETVVQVTLGQSGADTYGQNGIIIRENSDKMFVYQQIRLVPIEGTDAICEYGAVKSIGTGPIYIITDIDVYSIANTHHTTTFDLQILQ